MPGTIQDLVTVQQNGVQAVNNLATSQTNRAGSVQTRELSATTTIKAASGWVASVSVIVVGSTQGYLYDTNNSSNLTGNRIYAVPNTIGVYSIQMPFNSGLVFVPGTSSVIAVSYT